MCDVMSHAAAVLFGLGELAVRVTAERQQTEAARAAGMREVSGAGAEDCMQGEEERWLLMIGIRRRTR